MITRIPIDPSWTTLANDFATRSLVSRQAYLATRGQANVAKITQDIASGCVAEFAVSAWLESQGIACPGPDLQVYTGRQKSWAPDLVTQDQRIHVKTYSNPKWASWVFSYDAERGGDPLIEEPGEDDWLALTQVCQDAVVLHYFVKAGRVINLYRPPKLTYLQHSKLVLYPEDLDRLISSSASS